MTTGTQCVSWDAKRSCLTCFFNDRPDLFWHPSTSNLQECLPTPQGCIYNVTNITKSVKLVFVSFESYVWDA